MKNYVIIGGGVASIGCIDGIRKTDKNGKITLIVGEKVAPYCRPLISYFLQGKTDFDKMQYRTDEYYKANNCEIIYGEAEKIDTATKTVIVDKQKIPYDKLCVATGSVPFVPAFDGLDSVKEKFGFMTECDAKALNDSIKSTSRVLIIGAGLIGLKCAEGLSGRVASITVCDLQTKVLSSILDDKCAKMMQSVLENNGIEFLLGDTVSKFDKTVAYTKNGKIIDFDILVLAVGVRANTKILSELNANVNKGIIVDNHMQTSLPDIYSCGDCAEGYDASINANRIIAIWPSAYIGGETAGINMAGGNEIYDNDIPMNSIGFFGTHAATAGAYEGEMYEECTDNSLKRLYTADGTLKGFILIGNIARAGIYTSLVRNKTPLSADAMELIKKSPSLAVLSQENRRKNLGGMI